MCRKQIIGGAILITREEGAMERAIMRKIEISEFSTSQGDILVI